MLATLPLTLGAAGLVLLVAPGPLFRTGSVPLLAAFGAMALGALLGAAATTLGAIAVATAARQGQAVPVAAIAGLLLGAIAWGLPARVILSARGKPSIHDISTDLSNPPAFAAIVTLRGDAANSLEFSEAVAAQQRQAYADLGPVTLPAAPGDVFARAVGAAGDAGWELVSADESQGRIEATDTTRWFGFKDDVVVRLTAAGAGTRVDVRSVSRIGRGDLGTNARRIREYLARLQAS